MTKEELDIQKEIEKYFTESTGFGRDKIRNFMDIVNKALKQKGERIADLEKENTELTETLKTYNGCGDWDNDFHTCRVYLQHEELQERVEQLTKAKDIIKELIKYDIPTLDYEQAEQFIKEIEK